MSDEWGPWIEHDGKGCPCVGQIVESVDNHGVVLVHVAHGIWADMRGRLTKFSPIAAGRDAWSWAKDPNQAVRILRYRIRKPRGLTILENLIADLPAPAAPIAPDTVPHEHTNSRTAQRLPGFLPPGSRGTSPTAATQ